MYWGPLLTLLTLLPPGDSAPPGLIERYRAELALVRAGDPQARPRLLAAARELCERHGRCDAIDVAAHYCALSPAALADGLQEESRYLALRARVLEARERGLEGEAWAAERREVLEALAGLAARGRPAPDFVPAAQALSLRARLLVQRVEEDPALGAEERARILEEARGDAEDADALFARAGQRTPRLEPAWLLGRVDLAAGRHGAARARLESCLREAEQLGSDDFREHALEGLLALALAEGERDLQRETLERLARFRDPRACWPLASGWGAWLLHDDRPAQAFEFLARHPPASGAHRIEQEEWELLMGSALLRLGDLPGAREHLERASAAGSEAGVLALADLALREERSFEVEALLGDEDLLAQLSPRGAAEARRILGEALLARGEPGQAVEQLERALELGERWSERVALDPPGRWSGAGPRAFAESAASGVIGEWIGLHTVALLADAHRRRGDPLAALLVIEDSQSRSLRREGGPGRARMTREELAAWTAHTELGLLSWVVGADFTVCVWAGRAAGQDLAAEAVRIERGRGVLLDAARRLREAAVGGDARWLEREGERLWRELVPAPIAARLRAAAAHAGELPRLLLLLHGPLEGMPLELLGARALGVDAALLALPGLPESSPGTAGPLPAPWRLLGAPEDAAGRPRLPGAGEELEALASMHPGALVASGPRLTRATLLEAFRGGAPLHLATHLAERCGAHPHATASGALELAGGEQMCAPEIRALAPRLPLVVLSACAGGAGRYIDAEGLHGVARAFLASGTRNVLASLWPVEDGAALAFAVAFHEALGSGLSPARAAHTARARLRAAGHAASEWAAWRLLGRD